MPDNEKSNWSRAWDATKGAAISTFNFAKYVKNGDEREDPKVRAEREKNPWTADSALMAFGGFTCAMFLMGAPLTITAIAFMCAFKLGKKIYDYNKLNDINLPSQKLRAAYEMGKQFYGDNMPKLEDVMALTKDANGRDLTQEEFNERIKGQVEEFKKSDHGKALLSDIRVQQMFKNAFNIDLERDFQFEKSKETINDNISHEYGLNNENDVNNDDEPLDSPQNNINELAQDELNKDDEPLAEPQSNIKETALEDFLDEDEEELAQKPEKAQEPKVVPAPKQNRLIQFFKDHNPFKNLFHRNKQTEQNISNELDDINVNNSLDEIDINNNDLDINSPRETVDMVELDEYPISNPENTLAQIGSPSLEEKSLNKSAISEPEIGGLQTANK